MGNGKNENRFRRSLPYGMDRRLFVTDGRPGTKADDLKQAQKGETGIRCLCANEAVRS